MSHTTFALIILAMPVTAGLWGAFRPEHRDGRTQAPDGHLPRPSVPYRRDRLRTAGLGGEPGAPVRVLGQSKTSLPGSPQ